MLKFQMKSESRYEKEKCSKQLREALEEKKQDMIMERRITIKTPKPEDHQNHKTGQVIILIPKI